MYRKDCDADSRETADLRLPSQPAKEHCLQSTVLGSKSEWVTERFQSHGGLHAQWGSFHFLVSTGYAYTAMLIIRLPAKTNHLSPGVTNAAVTKLLFLNPTQSSFQSLCVVACFKMSQLLCDCNVYNVTLPIDCCCKMKYSFFQYYQLFCYW